MRYSVIHDGSCGPGLSTGLVWRSKEGWASCRFHVPFQKHPRVETQLLVAASHDSNLHFSWTSWMQETWQCLSLGAYPTPWEPWTGGPAFLWTEVGRTVFLVAGNTLVLRPHAVVVRCARYNSIWSASHSRIIWEFFETLVPRSIKRS